MTPQDLIAFEFHIADLFHAGKIPYPVHYSGRNEEQLIKIFQRTQPQDWVFSTWRSHYHALLKGMPPDVLEKKILAGDSMHIMDKELHFFSSSIVGGIAPIAVGVAQAGNKVWCFIGDGGEDQGIFYESVRYASGKQLPITFVIEDNNLSVDTTTEERVGGFRLTWPSNVIRYHYVRKWPHCQTGKFVQTYM